MLRLLHFSATLGTQHGCKQHGAQRVSSFSIGRKQ
jgi:hypothetical protein